MLKDKDFRCSTDFSQIYCFMIAIILIFCEIIFLVFAPQAIANWIKAAGTILTCLLIFGALWVLRKLVDYLHEKYRTKQFERYKTNLLIGFSGVALCGIIPRIIIFFIHSNPLMIYYCISVSLVTDFIFYYIFVDLFIFEVNKVWTVDYDNHWKHTIISIVVQVILLIATARIGYAYEDRETRHRIIFWQFMYAFLIASPLIDIGVVLLGGLKFEDQRGANVRLEPVRTELPKQNVDNIISSFITSTSTAIVTYPRQECKICMLEYNETVIPRMLKECGHTVCEGCADQLLKKNNRQHLFCPFCQKVTVVNGFASRLPKNYAIIDMIDEKKKNI